MSTRVSFLLGVAATLVLFTGGDTVNGAAAQDGTENWPKIVLPANAAEKVKAAEAAWSASPDRYWKDQMVDHTPTGDYAGYGMGLCEESDTLKADDSGILEIRVQGEYHYDPVLTAQCGLKFYGKWLRTNERPYLDGALKYGRKLVAMEDADGALRYTYDWWFYQPIKKGWTSAMAQGQALSLYVRLYDATKDKTFVTAGAKALRYMLTPIPQGGLLTDLSDLDPSLSSYIFLEEIVTQPSDNYILNGYMFSLLGLYDWSSLPSALDANQSDAEQYFHRGVDTLEHILPYYDMGGMSSYDLSFITLKNEDFTVSSAYNAVHIWLLHALYGVTGSEILKNTRDKWKKSIESLAD